MDFGLANGLNTKESCAGLLVELTTASGPKFISFESLCCFYRQKYTVTDVDVVWRALQVLFADAINVAPHTLFRYDAFA